MTATTPPNDEELLRQSEALLGADEEADDEEPPARQYTDTPGGMTAEKKAELAAGRARKRAERKLLRDPVEKAKQELKSAEAKSKVPNQAQTQRAVAANLFADAAMYAVVLRQRDGSTKYIRRYRQDEIIKFGDVREFIAKFLVPEHGPGTYEITPTTPDGVMQATRTFDVDPEGDGGMGANGAVAADLREIKTKLGDRKESVFEKAAAEAMTQMMQGGDASEMTMEKVMMYKMMGDMFAPKGPDPAVVALAAKVDAMLAAPPALPPPAPFVDPNALTLRDIMAMNEKAEARMREERAANDAKFEKMMAAMSKPTPQIDPFEAFEKVQSVILRNTPPPKPEDTGITANAAALVTGVNSVLDRIQAMRREDRAAAQGAPVAALPEPAAPAPQMMPPELPAKIAAIKAAKDEDARHAASWEAMHYCSETIPQYAPEFQAMLVAAIASHAAVLAKDTATADKQRGVVMAAIEKFHAEALMIAGPLGFDQACHDGCISAWRVHVATACRAIYEAHHANQAEQAKAAQPAPAPAAASISGGQSSITGGNITGAAKP